jgi:tripartite ATP-independent transporter DctM subunit
MLSKGYNKSLAVGTIASAGTLGILIPPSIMLVIMGDLIGLPVGTLFTGAIAPGLLMSALYVVFIIVACTLMPSLAPAVRGAMGASEERLTGSMVLKGFIPPAFLITLVLGSIFAGWATPTEASGIGSLGAILLAYANKRLSLKVLKDVMASSALTNSMVFFIIFGATLFSYVFRALGGDEVVLDILKSLGIDTGWEMLIFVMIIVFIMGFFFDWIEICLIVVPIFAPIMGKMDFGTSDLVHHLALRKYANRIPDATFRFCTFLHEGHGATICHHDGYLQGHRPVCTCAIVCTCAVHYLPRHCAVPSSTFRLFGLAQVRLIAGHLGRINLLDSPQFPARSGQFGLC